jgi:hypothetical protein
MIEKLRNGRQIGRMRGGSRFLYLEEQRILITAPEQEQQRLIRRALRLGDGLCKHRLRFRFKLIDRVILALENGQLVIEMRGDLAAMLAFSANKKRSPQYVATCYSRPRRRRFTRAAGSPAATPRTKDDRPKSRHAPRAAWRDFGRRSPIAEAVVPTYHDASQRRSGRKAARRYLGDPVTETTSVSGWQ